MSIKLTTSKKRKYKDLEDHIAPRHSRRRILRGKTSNDILMCFNNIEQIHADLLYAISHDNIHAIETAIHNVMIQFKTLVKSIKCAVANAPMYKLIVDTLVKCTRIFFLKDGIYPKLKKYTGKLCNSDDNILEMYKKFLVEDSLYIQSSINNIHSVLLKNH